MNIFRLIVSIVLFNASVSMCEASLIFNVYQNGANVVATGSGTVNLNGLTPDGSGGGNGAVFASLGSFVNGPDTWMPINYYSGIAGPLTFGSGGAFYSSSGTGDRFGINRGANDVIVPQGYVSGSALSGTGIWNNSTLNSLGLIAGTYTWTWGSGSNADFATLTIGNNSVPEPDTSLLLLSGFAVSFGSTRLFGRKKSV